MPMIKSYTNHVDCKNMSYPSCQVWDPAAQNWQSNNKVSKLEETFQAKDFSGVGALRPRLAEVWHIWPNDWSFQSRPWLQWCKIFQALSLTIFYAQPARCLINCSLQKELLSSLCSVLAFKSWTLEGKIWPPRIHHNHISHPRYVITGLAYALLVGVTPAGPLLDALKFFEIILTPQVSISLCHEAQHDSESSLHSNCFHEKHNNVDITYTLPTSRQSWSPLYARSSLSFGNLLPEWSLPLSSLESSSRWAFLDLNNQQSILSWSNSE